MSTAEAAPGGILERDFTMAGAAVLAVDSAGRVVAWNAAMSRMTGVPVEEAVGRLVPELFTLTGEDGTAVELTAELSGTSRLVTRDGRALWVETSCSSGGDGGLLTAVLVDRSAKRQLDHVRQLLLACVHHELHGPLTAIHGHAQLLDASVTDRRAAESLGAIHDAVRMMQRVIEDLVLVMEDDPSTGPASASEAIDIRYLLRRTIQSLPSVVSRTRVNAPPRLVLLGDRMRLQQCLLIVLGNAEKYAPDGAITVTVRADGEWGVIEIADEGPGIPEGERHLVLKPYYRSAATRDLPGSGLGLHIANVLTTSMGGRVELSSAPAGGLRVELRLPLAPAQPGRRSADRPSRSITCGTTTA